uniref:Carbonic anhydrase XVb n=1 Tax=Cyprinus carpio carpio TaxID=630221 RepID=A0A9J8DFG9_CYPCA
MKKKCLKLQNKLCFKVLSTSQVVTWPIISPIDIVTTNAQANANLTSFTFTGYDDNTVLTEIKNTGTTIKFTLDHQKMHVVGGDLPGQFCNFCTSTLFVITCPAHLFQLHIVNEVVHNDSTILPALCFFIEKLDRTKYYRYLGSLTTPNKFTELVTAEVHFPFYSSKIDMFSTSVYINKGTNSPQMVNMFRGVQLVNSRIVTSQVAGTRATGPVSQTVFDLDLLPLYNLSSLFGVCV